MSEIEKDKIAEIYSELAELNSSAAQIASPDSVFDRYTLSGLDDCLVNLYQIFINIEHQGLQSICDVLRNNIHAHLLNGTNLSEQECVLFSEWKSLCKAYVGDLNNKSIIEALLNNLSKEAWIAPMDVETRDTVDETLCQPYQAKPDEKNDSETSEDKATQVDSVSASDDVVTHDEAPEKDTAIQNDSLSDLFQNKELASSLDINLDEDHGETDPKQDVLADIEEELFVPNDAEENSVESEVADSSISDNDESELVEKHQEFGEIEEVENKENTLSEVENELFVADDDDSSEDEDFTVDQPLLGSHFEDNPIAEDLNDIEESVVPVTPKINNGTLDVADNTDSHTKPTDADDNFDEDFFGPIQNNEPSSDLKLVGLGGLDAKKEASKDNIDFLEDELFQDPKDSVEIDTSSEEYKKAFEDDIAELESEINGAVTSDSDALEKVAEDNDFDFKAETQPQEFADVDYNLDDPDSIYEANTEIIPHLDVKEASNEVQDWDDQQQELLALMLSEIEDSLASQKESAELFAQSPVNHNAVRDLLSLYVEQIERMGSAAEMVGLVALQQICISIAKHIDSLNNGSISQVLAAKTTILQWPQIIFDYLNDIRSESQHAHIIEYLSDSVWPVPISDEDKDNLRSAFSSSTIRVESKDVDKRIKVATEEAISIEVPDDVQAELLDGMLQELPRQTEEFSIALQKLDSDDYLSQLEVTQRIAHTIKGAANTVGITGLATLTHNLEDILQALVKSSTRPNTDLQNSLIEAADCLEQMSEYLLGMGEKPSNAIGVLQSILDWANYIDEFGPPIAEANSKAEVVNQASQELQESEKEKTKDSDKQNIAQEASVRVPAGMIDELLKQSGESIIATSQMQDQVSHLILSMREIKNNRDYVHGLSEKLEHLIDIQGVGGKFANNAKDKKFDSLEMDQFNELHTYSRRLIEATTDSVELVKQLESKLMLLDSIVAEQASAQKENQYTMLKTRMVPVDSIAARLKRGVRQAAKLCNKSVELVVNGGETLVDSKILTNLIDPLMHLLRNAVDHGIENDIERQANGKSLPGRIELTVKQDGDRMVVYCHDDGQGLNADKILIRAIARGLVRSDQELSKEEIYQLILKHGFSTRDEVTQLSGRGVGLDVVFSHVKELNGTVKVHSVEKKNTTIELSMPVSLLSAHALLVRLSIGNIAVSTNGVEEIIHAKSEDLKHIDNQLTLTLDDNVYSVIYLEELLGLPIPKKDKAIDFYTALIVNEIGDQKKIILVPAIHSTRDIIIKPFSQYLPKVIGLIGATVLGNGEIASVVDIKDLLMQFAKVGYTVDPGLVKNDFITAKVKALVVEDSISTRRSLAEFMQDLSYEVYTAKDGIEAIEVIKEHSPNILLTDLEMPRMNGLELTSHLRANEDTKHIPVIMITSRTTEKHIQEAKAIGVNEYLTKPFQEDLLLEKVSLLAPIV